MQISRVQQLGISLLATLIFVYLLLRYLLAPQ
jgi:hypothetical protein